MNEIIKKKKKQKQKWKPIWKSCTICESFTVWIDTTLTWKCFSTNWGLFTFSNIIQHEVEPTHRALRIIAMCACVFFVWKILQISKWMGKPIQLLFILLCAYFRGEIRCSKSVFPRIFLFSFWKILTEFLVSCSLLGI